MVLHGLQGHKLLPLGLLHRLQGHFCSVACSASSTPFLTVCRAVSLIFSHSCLTAAEQHFLPFLKWVITEAPSASWWGQLWPGVGPLEPAVSDRGNSWHLLIEATPATPPLPKHCHVNLMHRKINNTSSFLKSTHICNNLSRWWHWERDASENTTSPGAYCFWTWKKKKRRTHNKEQIWEKLCEKLGKVWTLLAAASELRLEALPDWSPRFLSAIYPLICFYICL